jgi:NADPH-dependent curcumin reductase CurA
MADPARRVVLVSRPVGEPTPENFRTEDFPVPTPGPGQVLLRTLWLSLDPYMRGRMSEAPSYAAPVGIGGTMVGGTVSEVIASNNPDFAAGDVVLAPTGWQTHAVSDGKGLRKIDPKLAPLSTALGILGMPGMTAYAGLLEIGKPQPGETVVVAAASGQVGSMVGQIAKIKGARAAALRAARRSAPTSRTSLALTTASTTVPAILPSVSRQLVQRASMSTSRTLAAPCSKRSCRCSTRLRACRCAA